MKTHPEDIAWMRRALLLAQRAGDSGEVPVGAVLVRGATVLGEAHNAVLADNDPTSHAELLAIRSAAVAAGNYRLTDTTLYTTLEPCAMCAGAIVHARIERVVIAALDPKAGAAGSVVTVIPNPRLNHRPLVEFGLLAEESASLLGNFFKARRAEGVSA